MSNKKNRQHIVLQKNAEHIEMQSHKIAELAHDLIESIERGTTDVKHRNQRMLHECDMLRLFIHAFIQDTPHATHARDTEA